MKKKFFAILFALLLVLSFGLIPAVPAAAYQNSIASSTLYFEGALTAGEGGVFTGTIAMTAGTYYIPGGPGTAWDGIDGRWETPDGEEAQGGFDIYAKSGGGAYVEGFGNWSIGSNHDAYSSGGPEGTQHDPDFRDWDMYSLELTADHWYLRYTQTNESPMSGTMVWHGDGTGYAAETDLGTQDGGHDGSAIHGGGAQAWDWDRDWGVEVIPLQYLGFDVQVTDLGGGSYSVTLTPAAGPYPSIVISPKDATITAGDTQAYTATAYDEYGNEVEDVTADTIFSIEAGAGGSWEPANVYTSEVAGEWQVTGTYGELTDCACLTVNPVSAVSFVFDAIGPQTAGVPFSITITAYDGGDVVTDYTGTAALSDLTGTIAPDVTTAFVDGVWTGEVTITGAMASNIITATDGDITGTSDPFDVNPVSAVSFVFDAVGPQTAGVPFSITITAYDGGEVATDYTGTAALSDLTGTIAPDVTTAFVDGVWTGDVTITDTMVNNTITATDDDITGTSDPFDVNPVPAVSFVFDAIGPQTAGVSFSITITAYDGGEVVTDYTGTAALSDLTGTIAPDVTTAFVDGVWTGDVTITGAMTNNRITATDGDITGTSDPFDVNPASAISIVISPDTVTIIAGESQAYEAYTCDEFGNEVGDVTADTVFSIEAGAGGSWEANVYTSEVAGEWEVTGTCGECTGCACLTVNPCAVVSIVISPDEATITAGDTQTYTAMAYDESGNEVGDVTADTVFSIEAGAGGSWEANVYTSEKAGTWQVTGTYEGLTDYASLTVEPSAVETLMIVQQPTDTTVGVVIAPPVTVKAVDELGNTIPDQDVIASLQVGTGTLSGNLTQVTDGSGIATFDNLSIDLAGVIKVLLFTVDSVTVDSNPFTVYPAPVYDSLFTLKAGWTLISTHREIDAELSEFVGATLVLKYTESGFLSATFADLKPVEALYVKMPDGGWVGLNYLDVVPGVSAKDLVAGWNLVSSATFDSAAAVLSPLRYVQLGEEQGIGLATVVSQGYYNLSGNDFYLAALTDADWEFLGNVTLIPFDGYWVYMNAAKVFGVIPGGES